MGTLRLGSSVVVPSVVNNISTPVIDPLSITPTTSQQTITAPSGTDGYSPITVDAVDNTIDSNITANNIKSGVTILGVTGNVVELNGETKTITPQTYGQTIYPTNPKNGITEITVNPVTSSIDANITAGNIKKDVQILGVTGTYEGSGGGATLITKTITANGIYEAVDDNADGYSQVTVNVPSSNIGNVIVDVKAYGKSEQNGIPTPTNPVNIVCNNGVVKVSPNGTIYTDGTVETVTDANNNTAECDYLLSLNGHQDTQELVYGKISRNIGIKILDGTEDWALNNNIFRCSNLVQNANDITLMCSHFAYTGDLTTDNTIYRAAGSNYLQIRYDTANNDVTTFKTFLAQQYSAGTPVIILYVRTNKYTVTVDGQTLEKTPISITGNLQNLTADIYESKDIISRTLVNDSSTNTISLYNSSSFDNDIFSTITDVKSYTLMYAFARGRYGQSSNEFINNGYIKGSINLSSLKNISVSGCYGMFEQQIGITSVDLSSLEIIDKANACYGMFKANTSLTSTGLSNLTTISGMNSCNGMYYGDTSLTSTGLSNLTTISGDYACQDMFRLCTGITSETFSKLDTITGSNAMFTMFAENGNLRYLAFPALTLNSFGSNTSQFNSMLYGCRSVVVHFPSNLSALLGSWTSIQNGFGGTNTTILFDLPATE